MSRIRLYFDEDAMQRALVVALRARRIDVLTASDSGMAEATKAICVTPPQAGNTPGSFSDSSSATPSANNCAVCCTS
jgi:hypothetical protein